MTEDSERRIKKLEGEVEALKRERDKNKPVYVRDDRNCYISTSATVAAGLPDDCDELQTLRQFRNVYMAGLPGGPELIAEYERIAPEIVNAIRKMPEPESDEEFRTIFKQEIIPAVNAVKSGDLEEALRLYKEMTEKLKGKYLSH